MSYPCRPIENLRGEVVRKSLNEAQGLVTAIRHLESCRIHCQGNCSGLRIEDCEDCVIWVEGSVSGSAFITGFYIL